MLIENHACHEFIYTFVWEVILAAEQTCPEEWGSKMPEGEHFLAVYMTFTVVCDFTD